MQRHLPQALIIAMCITSAQMQAQTPAPGQLKSSLATSNIALRNTLLALTQKLSLPSQKSLRIAQTTWGAFLETQCGFESTGQPNGEALNTAILTCELRLTKARNADLQSLIPCAHTTISCNTP